MSSWGVRTWGGFNDLKDLFQSRNSVILWFCLRNQRVTLTCLGETVTHPCWMSGWCSGYGLWSNSMKMVKLRKLVDGAGVHFDKESWKVHRPITGVCTFKEVLAGGSHSERVFRWEKTILRLKGLLLSSTRQNSVSPLSATN